MTALFELAAVVRARTREEFVRQNEAPFLLVSTDARGEEHGRSFKTSTISGSTADLARAMARGQVTISASVSRYEAFPVKKLKESIWSSRVSVGRARNNDITIDDASVSKMHAHFIQKDGAWMVTDAQSHNGLRINGDLIAANAPHVLAVNDQLVFGSVATTWLDAGALYDFIRREIIKESQP